MLMIYKPILHKIKPGNNDTLEAYGCRWAQAGGDSLVWIMRERREKEEVPYSVS